MVGLIRSDVEKKLSGYAYQANISLDNIPCVR